MIRGFFADVTCPKMASPWRANHKIIEADNKNLWHGRCAIGVQSGRITRTTIAVFPGKLVEIGPVDKLYNQPQQRAKTLGIAQLSVRRHIYVPHTR